MFQIQPFAEAAAAAGAAQQEEEARPGSSFKKFVQGLGARALEVTLATARGALAFPAGAERLIIDPIFPGDQTFIRDFSEQTKYSQEILQEALGLEESKIINFTGELAGAVAVGAPVLRTGKFLASRFPGIFRSFHPESARLAAATLGAEGALFEAGINPEATTQSIIATTVLSGGLGATATKVVARLKAKKVARGAESPEALADVMTNVERMAAIADDATALSDEALIGIRTALSQVGEGGALGSIRAVTVKPPILERLVAEFPDYRFAQIEDKLVYGLKPGTTLPAGTRSAPNLTDKVLNDFAETGFLRGEKILVGGKQEAAFLGASRGQLLVKPGSGKPIRVDASQVSRASGEVSGELVNPRLLEEFQFFKGNQLLEDTDVAIAQFINTQDDIVPALRPHAIEYLTRKMNEQAISRMGDERAVFNTFIAARNRHLAGKATVSLDDIASAKGFSVVRMTGNRVQLVDMATARGGDELLWTGEARARQFLNQLERSVPDVTPNIPGIPRDLLRGVALQSPPMPIGIDAGDQIATNLFNRVKARGSAVQGGVADALYKTGGRWLRGVEQAAIDVERRLKEPIFTKFIQPLSEKITRGDNAGIKRWRQVASKQSLGRLNAKDMELVSNWMASPTPEAFVTRTGMKASLVARGRETRRILDLAFDEMSVQSGTTLSVDDYFRNYLPAHIDNVAMTGNPDLIALYRSRGRPIPSDLKFYNQLFKSGELGQTQLALDESISRLFRSGYRKAFAGKEMEAARAGLETLDSDQAKRTLVDYLTGVSGNMDEGTRVLNEAFTGIFKALGMKTTPKQINNFVGDLVGASYSATMGFRVQLAMRNGTQMPNMLAPIIGDRGFSRTFRAMLQAEDPKNIEWALNAGIIRDQAPFTLGETLVQRVGQTSKLKRGVRAVQRLSLSGRLDPSKRPHTTSYTGRDQRNRAGAGIAIRDVMRDWLPRRAAGTVNDVVFEAKTGIDVFDESIKKTFYDLLEGRTVVGSSAGTTAQERAVNYAGREMANFTNALYGSAQAPAWIRSAPGKLFGGYSTFSFNYGNYVQTMARNGPRASKIRRFAKHGAFNYAVATTGSLVGLDLSRWVTGQSINVLGGTGWVGGPHVDWLIAGRTMFVGAPWQKDAAQKRFLEGIPKLLIPGASFARDIWTAGHYLADDRPEAAVARVLGFRVTAEPEQLPDISRR